LVYRGQEVLTSALEVPNPIIVVDVLSPSTRCVDASLKLAGYFRVPSLAHYLIVDPDQPLIMHHARGLRPIVREGASTLDPLGTFALAHVYGAA
jgi:Uma2 family endonuclease